MKKEEKRKLKKLYILIGIIIVMIVFIDQITKALMIHYGEVTIIPNVWILKVNEINNGTYEDTSKVLNILTNFIIICIIFGIIKSNNQFIKKKTKILLTFALAGGISNIIDRIFRGAVVEFINFANFPPINIADICIVIGWLSFVAIFTSFSAKELSNKRQAKEKNTEDKPHKSV